MNSHATAEAISLLGRVLSDLDVPTAKALVSLGVVEQFDAECIHIVAPLGLEAATDANGRVVSVHLHSDVHDGFRAFPFDYCGIGFTSARADVRRLLGVPRRSGVGEVGPWDAYDIDDIGMHFMYSADFGKVLLVTLTANARLGPGWGVRSEPR